MIRTIGMVEFRGIASGIRAADQMVKISDVEIETASSVCPGKYIVIVCGDVSAVEASVKKGEESAGDFLIRSVILPNAHEDLFPAMKGKKRPEKIDALGVLEASSLAAMVRAADVVLKAAELESIRLRLGDGIGGKAYFLFTGDVASVETGAEAGKDCLKREGKLIDCAVIAAPSEKLKRRF